MADANIELNTGSGGDKLATQSMTRGVDTVHREEVVIGDPTDENAMATVGANGLEVDVKALPASTNTIEVVGDAAENAAVAGNPVLTGGRYDAVARTLGDGDVGALALDPDGAVHIADGGNSLTVDGTVTANLSATDNAVLDNIDTNTTGLNTAVGTDAAAHGASQVGIRALGSDGTNDQQIAVDATGNVQVDIVADAAGLATAANQLPDGHNVTVDNAAGASAVNIQDGGNSITIDGTVTADAGTGSFTVAGDVAHDGIDSGNPVKVGGKAYTTLPTAAANADRVDQTMSSQGGALVSGADGTTPRNIAVNASGQLEVDISAQQGAAVTVDGSAVTQPVSGTVTANLSATDNTVLDNIDTNTTGLNNTVGTDGAAGPSSAISVGGTESGGNFQEVRVDADGHLQVDVLTGGGSGTEYTEDAVAPADPVGGAVALVREDAPVSIAADGDIVAQRGTQYGAAYAQIVDSSGNFIDTFGGSGGTAHGDDAAFTIGSASSVTPAGYLADETTPDSVDEGDVGVARMTLNRKAYAVLADPTAENSAGVDASGHLQVDIAADSAGLATAANQLPDGHNVTVDNAAGASAVNIQDGGNSITVDGTVTADAGTGTFTAGGDVAHDAVDSGNPVKIGGKAYTTLPTAAATADRVDQTMTTQGGALIGGTDGTTPRNVAVNASGQLEVDISAQQGAALDVSGATVTTTPAVVGGGTEAAAQRVTIANDSTGVLSVDYAGSVPTISNAAMQSTGDEAHDAPDAGNPVKVGMKAVNLGANPTDVAAADRTDWLASRAGIPFMLGGHPNIVTREYMTTGAQTNDAIIDTIAAGTAIVVTQIDCTLDNATTVDVQVRIGFGTASVPAEPASGASVAGIVLSHPDLAAGSGIVKGNGAGIIGVGASDEELRITCDAPTTGQLTVVVTYFTISI